MHRLRIKTIPTRRRSSCFRTVSIPRTGGQSTATAARNSTDRSTPGRQSCATTSRPKASRSTRSSSIPLAATVSRLIRSRPCCKLAPAIRATIIGSQTRTRLSRFSTRSEHRCRSCASPDNPGKFEQEKKPGQTAGLFDVENSVCLVGGGRGELCEPSFDRLEGLLGEFGIKPRDLLRLRYEGLVGRLRVFGLHFHRLVQGLHAG